MTAIAFISRHDVQVVFGYPATWAWRMANHTFPYDERMIYRPVISPLHRQGIMARRAIVFCSRMRRAATTKPRTVMAACTLPLHFEVVHRLVDHPVSRINIMTAIALAACGRVIAAPGTHGRPRTVVAIDTRAYHQCVIHLVHLRPNRREFCVARSAVIRRWNMCERFADHGRAVVAALTGSQHFIMIGAGSNWEPFQRRMARPTIVRHLNMESRFTGNWLIVMARNTGADDLRMVDFGNIRTRPRCGERRDPPRNRIVAKATRFGCQNMRRRLAGETRTVMTGLARAVNLPMIHSPQRHPLD